MYRTKLNLTDDEIMNKSWIALQLESADLPWYDYKGKKVITGARASEYLNNFVK